MGQEARSLVVALAGRRIDAEGAAEPRFPLEKVATVKERLRLALQEAKVGALVCSAACGVDLIALEAAGELGIRRRIVLPTNVTAFRESSVVDRPGPWGELFDRITTEVAAKQELFTRELGSGDESYRAANRAILAAAAELDGSLEAWIVWNGAPRDTSDITLHFADEAWAKRLRVREFLTVPRTAGAQPEYPKACFVAMPFGLKPNGELRERQIDFDAIYSTIIAPAIERAELPEGGTLRAYRTDRDPAPGLIDEDMWRCLELSRVTLCDLTGLNFNVGLELGVRYRAKSSGTVVFRQPGTPIAFDIAHVKVLDYDPATPNGAREAITNALNEALKQNRVDSPVQRVVAQVIAQPRTPELDNLLREAETALRNWDPGTARLKYLAATALEPNDATVWTRLATLELDASRWLEAARAARRATELLPDYSDAWREYGVAQNQLHRKAPLEYPDDGVGFLRKAIDLNPDDFDALASLGGALKRQPGKQAEALEAYRQSLAVAPLHPYPLLNVLKLEAATTGKLDLARYKPVIKKVTRLREEQCANTYDMPWSLFDSVELNLYQAKPAKALELLQNVVQYPERLNTFYESLSILKKHDIELAGLDQVLAHVQCLLTQTGAVK
jgi:tetratricopeptide (TPR) repeat protein